MAKYQYIDMFRISNIERSGLEKELREVLVSCLESDNKEMVSRRTGKLFSTEGLFRNRMMLIRDKETDELLGYASTRFYDRTYGGRRYAIISPSIYLKPEHRGGSLTAYFLMKQVFLFNLQYIRKGIEVIGFAEAGSPTAYYETCKYFQYVLPNREMDQLSKYPQKYQDVLLGLRKEFSLYTCEATENPLICKTLVIKQNNQIWKHRTEEPIQFFLEANPKFEQGYCLLIMNRNNFSDVLNALRIRVKNTALKKIGVRKTNFQARKL